MRGHGVTMIMVRDVNEGGMDSINHVTLQIIIEFLLQHYDYKPDR